LDSLYPVSLLSVNQAIAANYLLYNNLSSKILIIDLDVHQGNGTAEIFSNEQRVFTFSMHGEKNFPFHKEISDLDIPLPNGLGDDTYLSLLKENLPWIIKSFQPDFVFYLAGVDVLETDKLGKLKLSKSGCAERDRIVFETCREHRLPVQVSMGGGYSAQIKDIVDAHCNTFKVGFDIFDKL
jgi:acetoin utilization deacetylase AcuC-like enzyme